jgi:hypothetical protein
MTFVFMLFYMRVYGRGAERLVQPVALYSKVGLLIEMEGGLVVMVNLQGDGRQLLLGSPSFHLLNEGLAQALPTMGGIHPEQKNVGYPPMGGLICGDAGPNTAHRLPCFFLEDPPAGGAGGVEEAIQRLFQVIPVALLWKRFLQRGLQSSSHPGPIPG